MASEDSRNRDRCLRFIASVIVAMESESALRAVGAGLHHLEVGREQLEVGSLGGSQWMLFKQRHHRPHQVAPTLHAEAVERVAMVIGAVLLDDPTAPEHLDEMLERCPRGRRLA